MDFIPFEKVSLKEAKAALDGAPAPAPVPPKPSEDWTRMRQSQGYGNTDLTEQAWKWLEQLPPEVQPAGLVQGFPRITNRLAEIWGRPLQCEKYLDALMLDHRGSRKGFPHEIAKEIGNLKIHYITKVIVQHFSAWGDRIGW